MCILYVFDSHFPISVLKDEYIEDEIDENDNMAHNVHRDEVNLISCTLNLKMINNALKISRAL